MPLSFCPPELLALAHQLADVSGDVIRSFYRTSMAVEGKVDLSPVTAADRKAEQVLHVMLAQERPNDGIIGEEFGVERENAEYVWVIDPIDGTRAFVSGKPLFGTLIALLHEGVPVMGVIDQPILKERWIGAAGHETTLNGQRCRTRPCSQLHDAIVCMGPQAFPFGNAVSLDAYRRVAKKAKTTTVGGDCYSYGLIASGHIDLCIEHDLSLYDFAALVPVVEGAGGCITDWQGQKLTRESKGQILAASDSRLIEETVTLLEGVL
ncbi:MAG: histidinol-phosphatase [Bdellovibrionales bacterium]|jgi:histidinol phosphatase-like enzyme (inositol monophosphatase family)